MRAGDGTGFPEGPIGPSWSSDVLADLHAGALDDEAAAAMWPAVKADPQARAVLAALDATCADLATLSAIAPVPVPQHVATRLDAALRGEADRRSASLPAGQQVRPPAQLVDIAAARRNRRNRFLGWGGGLVAAAAAVAAIVLIALPNLHNTPGQAIAERQPGATRSAGGLALTSGGLDQQVLGEALGHHDAGVFADRDKLAGCLRANSIGPHHRVVSMAQVTMDGQPATLMVLTTGTSAKFRLLVVGNRCAAGDAATLGDSVVGPR